MCVTAYLSWTYCIGVNGADGEKQKTCERREGEGRGKGGKVDERLKQCKFQTVVDYSPASVTLGINPN
jgi:hypothetical protein